VTLWFVYGLAKRKHLDSEDSTSASDHDHDLLRMPVSCVHRTPISNPHAPLDSSKSMPHDHEELWNLEEFERTVFTGLHPHRPATRS